MKNSTLKIKWTCFQKSLLKLSLLSLERLERFNQKSALIKTRKLMVTMTRLRTCKNSELMRRFRRLRN